ncbi:hypothetical protein E4631_02045 [Hymenobacter sp. UV11]|uniref:hypothetical protein n=1 Tax=Hymenobacter sp. UV11 TaxID=1849735 RepID=UPI00105E7E2C|nr:hypothetical protein [Hymenobacter sp. UV11]TFZ68864.1 hypothetical protein E4631_02045 [Hymenobacter sp. UV11]
MKNILLLCACLLALATPLRAVAGPPADIVVVRILEFNGNTTAIITRGEGKSEKVEFASGYSDKKQIQGGEEYYKFLQRLYQEGYTLQSSFSPGTGGTVTLLFVKSPSGTDK